MTWSGNPNKLAYVSAVWPRIVLGFLGILLCLFALYTVFHPLRVTEAPVGRSPKRQVILLGSILMLVPSVRLSIYEILARWRRAGSTRYELDDSTLHISEFGKVVEEARLAEITEMMVFRSLIGRPFDAVFFKRSPDDICAVGLMSMTPSGDRSRAIAFIGVADARELAEMVRKAMPHTKELAPAEASPLRAQDSKIWKWLAAKREETELRDMFRRFESTKWKPPDQDQS